ncbi:ATP-binding protein [Paenibacillus xylaniclasticus]|uniref:ATP-binding protein n=1 Tax=Paenibacillus xylaniclasticus TaxID=588083 RepID=UPI000FDAF5AE
MTKEIASRAFEPFFTTKNKQLNYGLGLSYCYQVMKKHHGEIQFLSASPQGTTVQLIFPNERRQS